MQARIEALEKAKSEKPKDAQASKDSEKAKDGEKSKDASKSKDGEKGKDAGKDASKDADRDPIGGQIEGVANSPLALIECAIGLLRK